MLPAAIPYNIKRLRKIKGLSQADLAEQAGLKPAAYRRIEQGKADLEQYDLHYIAGLLGVSFSRLLDEPPRLQSVRFRSLKRLSGREQALREQVLMDVERWLGGFCHLEKVLNDHPQAPVEAIRKAIAASAGTSEEEDRAMRAAAIARRHFGLNEEEPVNNICGLLETHGIKVRCQAIDSDRFFGLSVHAPDGGPAIVVNTRRDISVERWIFTAAHELGHLVLHPQDYGLSDEDEDEQHEQEADTFAAHFLMPEDVFWKRWNEAQGLSPADGVLHVKRIFRVSYRTVLRRLAPHYPGNIWIDFRVHHKLRTGHSLTRHEEPQAVTSDAFREGMEPEGLSPADFMPGRLARLVRKAIDAEEISIGRGAEMLELPLFKMRDLTRAWALQRRSSVAA